MSEMEYNDKIKLLKKFQEELEKHSEKTGLDEVPSWHHGLMESYLVLEQMLGVDPNDINF